MLSDGIAYVTADRAVTTPFAQGFRVLDTLPLDVKQLDAHAWPPTASARSRSRSGASTSTRPSSASACGCAAATAAATLVLTRLEGRHTAVLCERL